MSSRSVSGISELRSFRAEDLTRLLRGAEPPCISIYLPTHRTHPDWKQDPVRFRGLLSKAEEQLAAGGSKRAQALIEPLRALIDEPFWEFALEGLAVFASESGITAYRLPLPVEEQVIVADSFHTKPLFKFLRSNWRYFVLALSQNAVTLYEGSSFGAGEVELRGVPASLREALGIPIHDRVSSSHGRIGSPVFHGRGPGREESKEELLKYFRAIDRALHDFLRDERAPLLLASVGYYHPIYREANSYPHVLSVGIEGNFERSNGEQIHAAAWPHVSRHYEEEIARWVGRYRQSAGAGLASDVLEEIAVGAVRGRVRCLLASEGAVVWGVFDRATGAFDRRDRQRDERDGDVVDDVCEEAFRRGAEVFILPAASMPTAQPVAAIYRF